MALISVDNLQVGMILSDDVYVFNNKLLLAKETPLTDYMINKLRFYGVKNIKVADFSVVDETATDETVVSESYIKRLKRSAEFKAFKEEYFKNVYQFKTDFLEIANENKKIDSEEYMDKISAILDGQITTAIAAEIALKKPFLSGILLMISTTLRSSSLKSEAFDISNPTTELITL